MAKFQRQTCCDNFIGWHVEIDKYFRMHNIHISSAVNRAAHHDDFVLYINILVHSGFIKSLLIPGHVIVGILSTTNTCSHWF